MIEFVQITDECVCESDNAFDFNIEYSGKETQNIDAISWQCSFCV